MREGLNALRDMLRGIHTFLRCDCGCKVCSTEEVLGSRNCCAHNKVYKRIRLLWEECVCPKGEYDQWHRLECVMGTCSLCGIDQLPLCPSEITAADGYLLRWKCFQYEEVGKTPDGRPRKRIKETFMETTPSLFLDYIRPKIKQFIKHSFVASWQDGACKEMMVRIFIYSQSPHYVQFQRCICSGTF